jgi:hypothetical protein
MIRLKTQTISIMAAAMYIKVTGWMEKHMGSAITATRMGQPTKDSGLLTDNMVMDWRPGPTVPTIRVPT